MSSVPAAGARRESVFAKLYRGDTRFDIIGKRWIWYTLSLVVIAAGVVSLGVRGLNLSIDFKGGDSFQFAANGHTVSQAQDVMAKLNVQQPVVQLVGEKQIVVSTKVLPNGAGNDEVGKVQQAIASEFGLKPTDVSVQSIGASWGSEITNKAVEGLVIFLVLTMLYIAVRFEGKMSIAAITGMVHDLIVTAGIYSLVGFQVSPSTVIALLTILGFSLYDNIVVFDRVKENTADLTARSNRTYSTAANVALNETLMRSINTSLISLLPVAALLFVGAGILGAGSLEDLALAQFIGLASGAYSSLFIATPLLAQMREREPMMRELRKRVEFLATHKPSGLDPEEAAALGGAVAEQATAGKGRPSRPPTGTDPPAEASAPTEPDAPAEPSRPGEQVPSPVGARSTDGAEPSDEPASPSARVPGSPMPRTGGSRRRGKRGRPSGKRR